MKEEGFKNAMQSLYRSALGLDKATIDEAVACFTEELTSNSKNMTYSQHILSNEIVGFTLRRVNPLVGNSVIYAFEFIYSGNSEDIGQSSRRVDYDEILRDEPMRKYLKSLGYSVGIITDPYSDLKGRSVVYREVG